MDEHILFRDGVPSRQTHKSNPHVSDRVVAVYTGPMSAVKDMGPMSIQHVRTVHARLCDIAARDVRRDKCGP
eukprot:5335577-Amphidinium_carterae.1